MIEHITSIAHHAISNYTIPGYFSFFLIDISMIQTISCLGSISSIKVVPFHTIFPSQSKAMFNQSVHQRIPAFISISLAFNLTCCRDRISTRENILLHKPERCQGIVIPIDLVNISSEILNKANFFRKFIVKFERVAIHRQKLLVAIFKGNNLQVVSIMSP